jgi:uncharacterized protein YbjT (DUF2867 family)
MAEYETVLVAGATGGTGRAVVERLAEKPPTVRAMTRDPDARASLRDRGADRVVVGDLLVEADARRATDDVDAVVCCVGSSIPEVFTADELVDGPGVVNLARAAADAGAERFVFQSAIGVGDSRERAPLLYRVPIAPTLEAKGRAEDVLREVRVRETILRPGVLTNGPARGYPLVAEGGDTVFGLVSRADVARLLVGALWTPGAAGRTFEVVSGRWAWGAVSGTVDLDWADPA